ncbi:alpha/beta fold hydrolase [Allokutzneria sp. A3M-2-11 16]|uniref:alpha/beta fold hydrolase n=1 Tax=Allokutzneria sp. A3M-2-11 16 TaxID=2962043 RepID=UPI0020B7FA49|nr:alpha/beta hydrolase [Allokutzneria sp. A3M-2-11 16]MCP3804380.1 alpha/beta fold hydrolase [Allokutzneria sp. A3M-2-11 16]
MPELKALNVGPSGIEIVYERFGDPGAPPVVLIMGAGGQLINWPEGFCRELVERGLQVIRFDNRDVGRSTFFTDAPRPDFAAAFAGDLSSAAYSLSDMAADTVGLLDVLGIARAHIVGASMGGAIGQMIAIEHPDRTASLTSIMSTTGEPGVAEGNFAPFAKLGGPPQEREAFIEWHVSTMRIAASPVLEFDLAGAVERAGRIFDRGYDPSGMQRQGMAVLATGDRTSRLRTVQAPTLVLHGSEDILCDISGGRATAAAIPGAEFVVVEGMAHGFPWQLWPVLATYIADHVARASQKGAGSAMGSSSVS